MVPNEYVDRLQCPFKVKCFIQWKMCSITGLATILPLIKVLKKIYKKAQICIELQLYGLLKQGDWPTEALMINA